MTYVTSIVQTFKTSLVLVDVYPHAQQFLVCHYLWIQLLYSGSNYFVPKISSFICSGSRNVFFSSPFLSGWVSKVYNCCDHCFLSALGKRYTLLRILGFVSLILDPLSLICFLWFLLRIFLCNWSFYIFTMICLDVSLFFINPTWLNELSQSEDSCLLLIPENLQLYYKSCLFHNLLLFYWNAFRHTLGPLALCSIPLRCSIMFSVYLLLCGSGNFFRFILQASPFSHKLSWLAIEYQKLHFSLI